MDTRVAKAVRQSHRKSRGGCLECKQRRVKCDELKPQCTNCSRRGQTCGYAQSHPSIPGHASIVAHPSGNQPGVSTNHSPAQSHTPAGDLAGSHFGTPRTTHSHSLPSQTQTPDGIASTIDTVPKTPSHEPQGAFFDLFDLELWNHWVNHASHTITYNDAETHAWQTTVREVAFANLYVARLTLAISAIHLSLQHPTRRPACMQRSAQLQSSAISEMLSTLSQAQTQQHCTPLFLASTLLCYCSFARGPEPGQYLAYSETGSPDWLGLLDGVRSILEGRHQHIAPGLVPDMTRDRHLVDPEEQLPGYRRSMQTLYDHIRELELEDSGFGKYAIALRSLAECVEGAFELTGEKRRVKTSPHYVFKWLYTLQTDYREALQARRPLALVVYAHYLVLMFQLRELWMIDGWPVHALKAVRRHLPLAYQKWIVWPIAQVPLQEVDGESLASAERA